MRSTVSQERLNHCMLLFVHKEKMNLYCISEDKENIWIHVLLRACCKNLRWCSFLWDFAALVENFNIRREKKKSVNNTVGFLKER